MLTRFVRGRVEAAPVFVMTSAQRWRPGWPLLSALLALSIFLALLPGTLTALRGPRLLGYQAVPTSHPSWWRVRQGLNASDPQS